MKYSESTWRKEIFYSQYQPNTTQTWCPMDTEERYKETLRLYRKKGQEFWWKPESFSYIFNEYGFRGPSPKSNAPFKILVSGCSYTMGIGLPYEETWPYLLSKKIPNSIAINLAMGGRSGDYVVRSIYKTIDIIKPNLVAVLWPPIERFDTVIEGNVITQTPHHPDYPKFFANDQLLEFYHNRNLAFLDEICKRAKVHLIQANSTDSFWQSKSTEGTSENDDRPARDNAHPGTIWQENHACRFYDQFQQLYK